MGCAATGASGVLYTTFTLTFRVYVIRGILQFHLFEEEKSGKISKNVPSENTEHEIIAAFIIKCLKNPPCGSA